MRLTVGVAALAGALALAAAGAATGAGAGGGVLLERASVASLPANASAAAAAARPCPPVPPAAAAAAGLTPDQAADLCWWGEEEAAGELEALPTPSESVSSPVPGVECAPATWCDSAGRCTPVCGRGSVSIPHWLAHALATQDALALASPTLCDATLPGSHNAAITLADGYGALDPAFSAFFRWIRWVRPGAVLRTHNQALSLTDQLRLGVRAVELDVHWVAGGLRIAHCGGFNSPSLDRLVSALNAVARLLRRPFKWDVETLGCSPSLSSIPATDQRPFVDAVAEVGAWLAGQGNATDHSARVVLVLYLDNQPDLAKWGALPALQAALEAGLPLGAIYTPADHAKWVAAREAAAAEADAARARHAASVWRRLAGPPPAPAPPPQAWPSGAALAAVGKRVVVVSGTDYGPAMAGFAFPRSGDAGMCGWAEPPLAGFAGPPACDAACGARAGCAPGEGRRCAGGGRIMRLVSCELQYGPLNCEFEWREDNQLRFGFFFFFFFFRGVGRGRPLTRHHLLSPLSSPLLSQKTTTGPSWTRPPCPASPPAPSTCRPRTPSPRPGRRRACGRGQRASRSPRRHRRRPPRRPTRLRARPPRSRPGCAASSCTARTRRHRRRGPGCAPCSARRRAGGGWPCRATAAAVTRRAQPRAGRAAQTARRGLSPPSARAARAAAARPARTGRCPVTPGTRPRWRPPWRTRAWTARGCPCKVRSMDGWMDGNGWKKNTCLPTHSFSLQNKTTTGPDWAVPTPDVAAEAAALAAALRGGGGGV
jgi:hypothetical protein